MGGSPDAPKTYSPWEQAQAQISIDDANRLAAEQAAADEAAKVEAQRLADITSTQDKVNQAYNTGSAYGTTQLSNLGYADTYGLLDTYNSLLGTAKSSVPEISSDPSSYFDYDSLWNQAVADETTQQQNTYNTQFNDKTGVGWQNNYFADTSDDAILSAILGEQYGTSFDTIDAAYQRGQLSEGAFNSTIGALDSQRSAADSTLQDLGLGVLSGYRDQLSGISDQWSDKITNYQLGNDVDLGQYDAQLASTQGELNNRMKGDIYKALGDTQLFNTSSLMAKGGAAAGVSNNPLRNAFNDQETDPTRTTGTTGVF